MRVPEPDTIAAIATAPGMGGVGVVRVSGPGVAAVAQALCGKVLAPRVATFSRFVNARGEVLDEGLALWFPAPASYTGEPVLELQGHGGPVVLHSVLSACLDAGARVAEPGEFTRRAFLNGKLDLAQAEAVADLIEASTDEAARCALRSLSGEFSSAIDALVDKLTQLRVLVEAMLDFPEEEIDELHREDLQRRLAALREALEAVISRSRQGSLLRTGVQVVLVGRPNVGKSSLLNCLAGEERAIVTPIPGTTRDAVRETIQLKGIAFSIIDTAGLRETSDVVERLGMERTWHEVSRADIVLVMFDERGDLAAQDTAVLARLPQSAQRIHIRNKIDLVGESARVSQTVPVEISLSAQTGEGVDLLRAQLLDAAGWRPAGEGLFLARERHLRALSQAGELLSSAAQRTAQWELLAEDLRLAQLALSGITGEFSADDLLGEIFSRFCIGK